MPDVGGIAGDRLRSFVERLERLNEEISALNQDKAEVFAELKGDGFDAKIVRQIIKIRAMDKDDRDEQESLLDVYMRALGMLPDFESAEQFPPRARTHTREKHAGPLTRMIQQRAEIFDRLEADEVIPSTDRSKTVYFAHAPDLNAVKIGISSNVQKRLAGLRGAAPVELKLLGTISGGRVREMELHRQFGTRRLQGEWFEESEGFLAEIAAIVAGDAAKMEAAAE